MQIEQSELTLGPFDRGFHLVTREIVKNLPWLVSFSKGLLHLHILHTSASLTLNENADSDVRGDFRRFFDLLVPEGLPQYVHTYEGPDDMPAHIKSSLLGSSVLIPVQNGRLALGTWQGIYLCEHRNSGGVRRIVGTVIG